MRERLLAIGNPLSAFCKLLSPLSPLSPLLPLLPLSNNGLSPRLREAARGPRREAPGAAPVRGRGRDRRPDGADPRARAAGRLPQAVDLSQPHPLAAGAAGPTSRPPLHARLRRGPGRGLRGAAWRSSLR